MVLSSDVDMKWLSVGCPREWSHAYCMGLTSNQMRDQTNMHHVHRDAWQQWALQVEKVG